MVAYALDATAALLTLRVTRGRPFRASVSVSLQPSGDQVAITADQSRMFVTLYQTGEKVIELTVAEFDPPQPGAFLVYTDEAVEIEEGSYWWELEWLPVSGPPMPLVEGVFEVCNRGRRA
jgi:hypothetical protein